GLSETTIDNVTGFYITPGDYRELAERIGILSTSPTLAKDFSSAARSRAVKRFSRERQVTDIAALLSADSNQLSTNTDRKSTRLNSSHVKTSYAVFCLKKKNSSHV